MGRGAIGMALVATAIAACGAGTKSEPGAGTALAPTVATAATALASEGPVAGERDAIEGDDSWPVTPAFTDITAESGVAFVHRNGMTGQRYFVEIMGAGAAVLDYDGDDDLDIFLAQGRPLRPAPTAPEPRVSEAETLEWSGRLLRNDLQPGPDGAIEAHFADVTAASGLITNGYGMGAAVGDIDNDGDSDLYLTNWGANQLWRNNGDGTFADVTAASGTGDPRWSVSASFVDYDRDGWLDLYVGNYVDFSYQSHHPCYNTFGAPDYCSPSAYPAVPDRLYRNRGDGTFEDVSASTGIAAEAWPALGVVATDVNADGWPDIYVANDGTENSLWLNDEGRRFTNAAVLAGAAVDASGRAQGSMGIVAPDVDGDGDEDLFLTHLKNETNTLYVNDGTGLFRDETQRRGLAGPSLPFTGFGVSDGDVDNDGWPDIAVVNGAVVAEPLQAAAGDPLPLAQTDQVFRNRGRGEFFEATAGAGPAFGAPHVGRGLAAGDLDNDGDLDLVVTANNGPARILRNDAGAAGAWIGLRLVEGDPPRDSLGARVEIVRGPSTDAGATGSPDDHRRVGRARTDGSYASVRDPRVIFGLGDDDGPQSVAVTWPDGGRVIFGDLRTFQYHWLRRGSGEAAP